MGLSEMSTALWRNCGKIEAFKASIFGIQINRSWGIHSCGETRRKRRRSFVGFDPVFHAAAFLGDSFLKLGEKSASDCLGFMDGRFFFARWEPNYQSHIWKFTGDKCRKLMRIENRFYIDDTLDCYNMSQMLHVWNIYIHLAESNDKCR